MERNKRRCGCLPASLRKLSLSGFDLDSDDLSGIGKSLPNLEVLKLHQSIKKWSVNDDDFPNLKVLKILSWQSSFDEWEASEDSFLNLEQLWLYGCDELEEIPPMFADIPNLRLISIRDCNPSLDEVSGSILEQVVIILVHQTYSRMLNVSAHVLERTGVLPLNLVVKVVSLHVLEMHLRAWVDNP
ncbi:hypothetical protein Leryth_024141 [Lithospermum erythrorhizon]|nr:hypothetical protein Leryth_024141 [Lithospermum erythrorhizon]